jgi:outer membrane protein assembly complex protein YaeT
MLGLLLAAPVGLAAAPEPPEPDVVLKALRITGAHNVPTAKIQDELSLPLPGWLPWKKQPPFREDDLERDLSRVRSLYRKEGFYHADIRSEVKVVGREAFVELHIDEGPWVKVTQVQVAMAPPVAGKPPLAVGQRFTVDRYDALKRYYVDYLLDHGYPRAKAEGRVFIEVQDNAATVEITLTAGPRCTFGPVKVVGEVETPEYIIRRKLTFKPGDAFSFKELYDSQRQIYATDLFQSVTLTPEEGSDDQTIIPIAVVVQEKKKRAVKVGLGYGDEEQFRAKLSLRYRNFMGGGRTLDLDGKYSYIENRVEGSFANPQLWASRNDLVIKGGGILRYLPGYDDRALYTQERLERDLPWRFRGYVGHGLEFARPFNIPLETLILLSETQTGKLYRASMAMAGLRQDTADNVADPHKGGLIAWDGQVAPDFFGSNMQFARTVAEVRRYQALFDTDLVLAGRLKCGVIQPIQATSDIPIFRRFFSGGYNSVRGYRLDYLGPRNPGGQPIGGEGLMEGSVEARIPIYKDFRGVAFLDWGNVFLKLRDMDVGQLKYAAGFGLRYQTIIGPVGVDVGFPLNPINPTQDRYRVHFTIGQAF